MVIVPECRETIYSRKEVSLMRKPLVLFFLLLAIFSWIWISRARNPSNRPDSYADGLQDSAYWWSDVSAEPVSSQWQLSAGVPENYIPVPG